eukprot:TRINITY_DN25030_c0_g1_i1.p1 TRINITY_DN25030_c0_g1~~TRINITY_DN25030_c0_g1_i1.p1  ORF type:complete len:346 (+),score=94.28 TRINITY_DN25030_c0_g1_i1:65-1039(+)
MAGTGPDGDRVGTPGTRDAKIEAMGQHDEEGTVEADFSDSARILQQGLPHTHKPRVGRLDDTSAQDAASKQAEDERPKERIANPFQSLVDFDQYNAGRRAQSEVLIQRSASGTWKTTEGTSYADVVKKNDEATKLKGQVGVSPIHPDVEPPVGSDLVDKILGPGVADIKLKQDVSDYISRRDEMKTWWREKMKSVPSKNRPGMMLGIDVPPRDAIRDHSMMMAQYGKGHMPKTTEEWEIHNTWEHKRKYMMRMPTEPRYIKWGRRLRYGVIASVVMSQLIWLSFNGYKSDTSYRHSTLTDVTHLTDRHTKGYESKCKYPFTSQV